MNKKLSVLLVIFSSLLFFLFQIGPVLAFSDTTNSAPQETFGSKINGVFSSIKMPVINLPHINIQVPKIRLPDISLAKIGSSISNFFKRTTYSINIAFNPPAKTETKVLAADISNSPPLSLGERLSQFFGH